MCLASLEGEQRDGDIQSSCKISHLQAQSVIATMTGGRHLTAFPQDHGGYKDHDRGSQRHQQALQDSAST